MSCTLMYSSYINLYDVHTEYIDTQLCMYNLLNLEFAYVRTYVRACVCEFIVLFTKSSFWQSFYYMTEGCK